MRLIIFLLLTGNLISQFSGQGNDQAYQIGYRMIRIDSLTNIEAEYYEVDHYLSPNPASDFIEI